MTFWARASFRPHRITRRSASVNGSGRRRTAFAMPIATPSMATMTSGSGPLRLRLRHAAMKSCTTCDLAAAAYADVLDLLLAFPQRDADGRRIELLEKIAVVPRAGLRIHERGH